MIEIQINGLFGLIVNKCLIFKIDSYGLNWGTDEEHVVVTKKEQ